jgi:hypothetical protein
MSSAKIAGHAVEVGGGRFLGPEALERLLELSSDTDARMTETRCK